LTREDGLFVETVYSNADGRYVLRPMQQGKGRLRARRPGFVDVAVDVDAAAGGRNDFRLVPVTDPVARSEQLTASAHFARLPFERELDRQWFQVECLTCHQIGNLFTRLPRTDERWREIMTRMLGFYGVTDAAWIDRYARLLGSTYDGEPHAAQQTHSVDVEALPARILQWKLPGAVIAHDVELYSKDGRFYTVDQGTDQIYITDPVTTVTETYNIPDGGIPQGGKFFKRTVCRKVRTAITTRPTPSAVRSASSTRSRARTWATTSAATGSIRIPCASTVRGASGTRSRSLTRSACSTRAPTARC
jgi:hypothetical protein